jgi:hypothetical protein
VERLGVLCSPVVKLGVLCYLAEVEVEQLDDLY